MIVAACFVLGIMYLYFAGFGLSGLLLGNDRHRMFVALLNGLCLTVIVFSETVLVFHSATTAFLATITTAVAVNVAFLVKSHLNIAAGQLALRRSTRAQKVFWSRIVVFALAAGIVVFCTWSFFSSGWHSYWGSANEDIFDGLYGRDAYLNGSANEIARFLDPLTHYQYSSLAFWSILFQSFGTMNVFYLQGQLMLFLQVLGIYFLTKRGFGFSHRQSLLSALLGSCSAFYISTFFTGHEGSLIFGAMIPFLLAFGLTALIRGRVGWGELLNAGLWLFMILHTYVFPLGFTVIPFVFFSLYFMIFRNPARRLRLISLWGRLVAMPSESRRRFLKYVGLLVSLGFLALVTFGVFHQIWYALEPVRIRATTVFRSWGISHYREMLLIYWGILPSSIPFGVVANPARLDIPAIMISGYVGVALLVGALLYGARSLVRQLASPSGFLVFFFISWCFLFLAMKYMVIDSYYLYKFYYTNYYVGAILLVAAGREAFHPSSVSRYFSSRWPKAIVGIFGGCWIGLNMLYITLYNVDIASRPYNAPASKLTDVSAMKQFAKAGIFYNLPKFDLQNLLRYVFQNNAFPFPDAVSQFFEYELEVVGVEDIVYHRPGTRTLAWENDTFRLYKSNRHDKLVLNTYYQGERYPNIYNDHVFRWVRDKLSLDVIDPSPGPHGLFLCVEPGPGVSYRPFWLHALVNGIVLDSTLVQGVQCVRFNIPALSKRVNEVKIFTREKGRNFLPWEERYLNYRVALIGLSDDRYPGESMRILNAPDDIVPPRSWDVLARSPLAWKDSADLLFIGNNWNPVEHDGSEKLRWVYDKAQLLIFNPTAQSRNLTLTIEKGPALVGEEAKLQILLNGNPVGDVVLDQRSEVKVMLPAMDPRENIITLHVDRIGKPVGRDPRILNFRVFNARLSR